MYRKNFDTSKARAFEARSHNSRHTFIEPETLLHLIAVHKEFLRIRELVEQHATDAQNEKRPYNDADHWLWSQALGLFETG